mmetsp:Transcript_25015/g.52450  ORF Transcript_25015/g.52450 Transcript_25015/m.52450 type:complete len:104 (-) Transcript_25015:143-454(-)
MLYFLLRLTITEALSCSVIDFDSKENSEVGASVVTLCKTRTRYASSSAFIKIITRETIANLMTSSLGLGENELPRLLIEGYCAPGPLVTGSDSWFCRLRCIAT